LIILRRAAAAEEEEESRKRRFHCYCSKERMQNEEGSRGYTNANKITKSTMAKYWVTNFNDLINSILSILLINPFTSFYVTTKPT